jgi:hypothetical protein
MPHLVQAEAMMAWASFFWPVMASDAHWRRQTSQPRPLSSQ